ncbi:exodeoxyribonuclease III [Roseofilum casamattae]|uniref:Exodeoxyribonuclease III n=1 Tax=Roseofilum casamattae BLCC-M143 TaxID=3022442 RepID=A0ABT7BWI2_9CYAN|nr:exodeoxyribonuclease III [Roseofilum casamattae]MDJ1183543.1 exodeoxyribonuclease III [Roseofilum casamattae BLCC-M143]
MKIATWNVNSIRTRLDIVCNWLKENPVDILGLQETKVVDAQFPRSPLEELGYHVYISGQKAYNGVALLSREPLSDVSMGFAPVLGSERVGIFDDQKRLITGVLDGIRIITVYVPNGSDYLSDKYHYKLDWLVLLQEYLQILLSQHAEGLCINGDFNIVPEDRDVYFEVPENSQKTGTTPKEREALQSILQLGLTDAFRQFNEDEGQYSWWDYRQNSFKRGRGWRIDHHYLSEPLRDRAKSCIIDVAPRHLTRPSDHTPVIVEF